MSESKNDSAWGKLFEKHQILDRLENSDYFPISSKDINEFREARLMTKFDHRSQMPKIFSDNKLSILSVSRGDIPSKKEVVEMMRNDNLHNVKSDKTYERRSSTVLAWIEWIISLVEE